MLAWMLLFGRGSEKNGEFKLCARFLVCGCVNEQEGNVA